MKYILILLTTLLLTSCSNKETVDFLNKQQFKLKKFNVKEENKSTSSAYFLLIGGSYSSETVSQTSVRFYFLNHKKQYQFHKVLLEDVRIVTDSMITEPYIQFMFYDGALDSYIGNPLDMKLVYDHAYLVIIHCKESDFVTDLNINNLK